MYTILTNIYYWGSKSNKFESMEFDDEYLTQINKPAMKLVESNNNVHHTRGRSEYRGMHTATSTSSSNQRSDDFRHNKSSLLRAQSVSPLRTRNNQNVNYYDIRHDQDTYDTSNELLSPSVHLTSSNQYDNIEGYTPIKQRTEQRQRARSLSVDGLLNNSRAAQYRRQLRYEEILRESLGVNRRSLSKTRFDQRWMNGVDIR